MCRFSLFLYPQNHVKKILEQKYISMIKLQREKIKMAEKEKMNRLKKVGKAILEHKRWLIVAIAIIIFVSLAEDVLKQQIFEFDKIVYNFLLNYRTQFLTTTFKIITTLGGAFWLITISILCIIFIKKKKYKLTIPCNLATIAFLNIILKNLFNRPRPDHLRIIEETRI